MKIILIVLLLIISFINWLPIPAITQVASAMTSNLNRVPIPLISNSKNILISQTTSDIGDSFVGGSSGLKRPSRQRPGAGRGICTSNSKSANIQDSLPLTPLRPITQKLKGEAKENSTWIEIEPSLTASEHPTFWFYVSEPETSGKKAEFMLLYKNDAYAIKEPIPVRLYGMPGFLSFTLDNVPLNDGLYHWFFTIVCDVKQPARNQNVEGWIEKVPVSKELKAQLAEASETQRIEIYFQNKIWHEFVDLIARKQQDIPNEKITLNQKSYTIGEVWNQILTEVGL